MNIIDLGAIDRLVKRNENLLTSFKIIDDVDGDVTSKITTNGKVDTSINGIYEIEYAVEDSHGNKSTAKQEVEVRDKLNNGLPVLMYHFFYSKDDPNYAGKTPG